MENFNTGNPENGTSAGNVNENGTGAGDGTPTGNNPGNTYGSDSYSNYNYNSTFNNADNTWRAADNMNQSNPYGNPQNGGPGFGQNGNYGPGMNQGPNSGSYGAPKQQTRKEKQEEKKRQKQLQKQIKKQQKNAKRAAKSGAEAGMGSGSQTGGSGSFGVKLLKVVAVALVFGLVAGSVFEGTRYFIGDKLGTNKVASANVTEKDTEETTEKALDNSDATIPSTTVGKAGVTATDVTDVVDAVMPSIVAITNISITQYQSFFGQTGSYENESCGSGIIVAQDADYIYIATNNHVVEGAETLTVQFADDSTVSAEVKGVDDSRDLAVVEVANSSISADTLNNIKIATIGNCDELKVGQSAIAIGNALGYGQSVTTGVISAMNRDVTISDSTTGASITNTCIQTDAAINPGNSGGALLNTNGEVIGINEVKYANTSVEGIGYAIPMSTAQPIIEQIITREVVSEDQAAYLGIQGIDVTNEISSQYNMPMGVYVAQVVAGSPAEQAGIQTGDIITSFDGNEIDSKASLENIITYYSTGTQVQVVIKRADNGQYVDQTLTVTLGSKNQ